MPCYRCGIGESRTFITAIVHASARPSSDPLRPEAISRWKPPQQRQPPSPSEPYREPDNELEPVTPKRPQEQVFGQAQIFSNAIRKSSQAAYTSYRDVEIKGRLTNFCIFELLSWLSLSHRELIESGTRVTDQARIR